MATIKATVGGFTAESSCNGPLMVHLTAPDGTPATGRFSALAPEGERAFYGYVNEHAFPADSMAELAAAYDAELTRSGWRGGAR